MWLSNHAAATISPLGGTTVGFTQCYGNKLAKPHQIQAGDAFFAASANADGILLL